MKEFRLFSKLKEMYNAGEKLFPEEYYMLAMYIGLHPEDSEYGTSAQEQQLINNLMHLAAAKNHARALFYLANHERSNKNQFIEYDYNAREVEYLQRAFEQEHYFASFYLCKYYWQEKDYINFWKYLRKSCVHQFFYNEMEDAYFNGYGVEQNQKLVAIIQFFRNQSFELQDINIALRTAFNATGVNTVEALDNIVQQSSEPLLKYDALYLFNLEFSISEIIDRMEILANNDFKSSKKLLASIYLGDGDGDKETASSFINYKKALQYDSLRVKAFMHEHGLQNISNTELIHIYSTYAGVTIHELTCTQQLHSQYAIKVAELLEHSNMPSIHPEFYRYFAEQNSIDLYRTENNFHRPF